MKALAHGRDGEAKRCDTAPISRFAGNGVSSQWQPGTRGIMMPIRVAFMAALLVSMLLAAIVPAEGAYANESGLTTGALSNSGGQIQLNTQETSLSDVLDDATGQQVLAMHYLDNTRTAAVAVTGQNSQGLSGRVWYVTRNGAKLVYSASMALYPNSSSLSKVTGGHIFTISEGGYGSGSHSDAWFVKNGAFTSVGNMGMDLRQAKGNVFTSILQAFDSNIASDGMKTGHTYKRYYFKWTGKSFVEYGGMKVSIRSFKKTKNGTKVLKAIKKDVKSRYRGKARIRTIWYRGNGVVNVNVSYPDAYDGTNYLNYTLRLSKGRLSYFDPYSYAKTSIDKCVTGGKYVKRSKFAKASYPKKFPTR